MSGTDLVVTIPPPLRAPIVASLGGGDQQVALLASSHQLAHNLVYPTPFRAPFTGGHPSAIHLVVEQLARLLAPCFSSWPLWESGSTASALQSALQTTRVTITADDARTYRCRECRTAGEIERQRESARQRWGQYRTVLAAAGDTRRQQGKGGDAGRKRKRTEMPGERESRRQLRTAEDSEKQRESAGVRNGRDRAMEGPSARARARGGGEQEAQGETGRARDAG